MWPQKSSHHGYKCVIDCLCYYLVQTPVGQNLKPPLVKLFDYIQVHSPIEWKNSDKTDGDDVSIDIPIATQPGNHWQYGHSNDPKDPNHRITKGPAPSIAIFGHCKNRIFEVPCLTTVDRKPELKRQFP